MLHPLQQQGLEVSGGPLPPSLSICNMGALSQAVGIPQVARVEGSAECAVAATAPGTELAFHVTASLR